MSRSPAIVACLVMAVAAGMVFNVGTALPVLATRTFGLGGAGYGALICCFGVGAIPGGLAAAYSTGMRIGRMVRLLCLFTGLAVVAVASAPAAAVAFPLIVVVGFLSIWMIALANTLVQVRSDSDKRGRVMGLWTMALPGLSPITGIIIGATTQFVGPRAGYALAGFALAGAAAIGWRALSE